MQNEQEETDTHRESESERGGTIKNNQGRQQQIPEMHTEKQTYIKYIYYIYMRYIFMHNLNDN